MKYAYILAASAALVSAHNSCSCTTWVETIYGEATAIPVPPKEPVEVATPTPEPEPTPQPTEGPSSPEIVTVIPEPGTYTFEPTTVVVPDGEPTTIIVTPVGGEVETTVLPPGTYTAPATTITVTENNFVYVCPLTDVAAPAPEPTKEVVHPAPKKPAYIAPAPEPKPEVDEYPVKPPQKKTKKPSPPKSAVSTQGNRPNGSRWAMTYTPYTESGNCKDAGQVMKDLAEIKRKGFTTVRVYGTDCSGLQSVGDAADANDIHMIVGVFIDRNGIGAARSQVEDIVHWKRWDLVDMVVVGNEALFNGYASAPELAAFITESREQFRGAGFNGPVTTAETAQSLTDNGEVLCPVIDVVGANIHPFFNPQLPAEEAGAFVANEMARISDVCGNSMPAYNLECGWPHGGKNNEQALANKEAQRKALSAIEDLVGDKVVFFSFSDDYWKSEDPNSIERFFGSLDIF